MSTVKIFNGTLNNVTWNNASNCDYTITNDVDIWRISVSENLTHLNDFLAVMKPDEVARGNRFYRIDDRNRHIVSRGAMRNILGRYLNQSPTTIEFKAGLNNKPYIENNVGLCFNLSHSGDWILMAVSNAEIGVDTEFVNSYFRYTEVLEDNFNTAEIAFINQTSSIERFFLLWTRKESLIKATGKGLDDNLRLITCIDGVHSVHNSITASTNDWLINSFKVDENYSGAIATNTNIGTIRFWDIDF
jgi:4'-phosphopantetheinyl transferase